MLNDKHSTVVAEYSPYKVNNKQQDTTEVVLFIKIDWGTNDGLDEVTFRADR